MKMLATTAIAGTLLTSATAHAESTEIMPAGSRPSSKGPEAYFTGSVAIDPLYAPNENTSNSDGLVNFEPGARFAWHTHPAGQVLVVTVGTRLGSGGWRREAPDPKDYDYVMGVNLRGIWNCMKFELQQMRKQGSGTIANNSSLVGIAGRAIYHGPKHGVVGLTKSAGLEYAARGWRASRKLCAN